MKSMKLKLQCLLALALLMSVVSIPFASQAAANTYTVSAKKEPAIRSMTNWVITNVTVSAGQRMTFQVSGETTYGQEGNGISPLVSSDGSRRNPNGGALAPKYDRSAQFPDFPIGALLGTTVNGRTKGKIFVVKNGGTVVASEAGTIAFAYNDVPGGYTGNGGSYTVSVSAGSTYGCSDPWVTEAIEKVMGSKYVGSGNSGTCDIKRYGNGSWSSKADLVKKVELAFGRGMGGGIFPFNELFYKQLDYGLYWYGKDNQSQKFIPGIENLFYNPDRKTIIYVHGWAKDDVQRHFRESAVSENGNVNIFNDWIAKGWNVGVFYWNQFSDDDPTTALFQTTTRPEWTEAKIWVYSKGKDTQGMRWRSDDGNWYTGNVPANKSAGDLLYDTYIAAMAGQRNKEIRLAGHSLGNQMVTRLAKLVSDNKPSLRPTRIALLDPYYTWNPKDYLGINPKENRKYWTGELVREYAADLISKGVAIEMYRSSGVSEGLFGDANEPLRKMVAFNSVKSSKIKDAKLEHAWARDWYFSSISKDFGGVVPAASATDQQIKAFMSNGKKYKAEGDDYDPGNDKLFIENK